MHRRVNAGPSETPASSLEWPCHLGRVLVVDLAADLRDTIVSYLNDHQCVAVGAASADALHQLQRRPFSLVVLEVRPGPLDGFGMLRQIRSRSDIPVILITGRQVDDIDRIVGLELGADDYIAKPFDPRELLARARAILRRQAMGSRQSPTPAWRGCRFDGWELRRRTRTLTSPAGETVHLSKGECALLMAFLAAPLRPLSREHLLRAARAHEDIFDRSIDVQVLRLRRKLEADPGQPRLIRTERGRGYTFASAVEPVL